jgi:hypothetical protein
MLPEFAYLVNIVTNQNCTHEGSEALSIFDPGTEIGCFQGIQLFTKLLLSLDNRKEAISETIMFHETLGRVQNNYHVYSQ